MAHGLKYELHGKSVPFGKNWKVRISREGYTGPQIDRNVPSNPFTLKKDSAGTVRGTSLDFAIRAIADFEFMELYTENSQDWLIELVDHSDVIVWKGFIIPEQYQEPYSPAPCTVSFTATDQLGLLKNFTYNYTGIYREDYLFILKNCLANTGLSLGFAIAIAIKESRQDQAKSVLKEIHVDPTIYNGMTCYDVIVDILSHFDAEITQHAGRWLIRSRANKQVDRVLYDNAGIYESTQAAPALKTLGSFGAADVYPTGGALALTLATSERKILISEDYKTKSTLLPLLETETWTDDNTPPSDWTVDAYCGVLRLVRAETPYVLVSPKNDSLSSIGWAQAVVNEVSQTADSVEFSFDYAYITPEFFPIETENAGIVVEVQLYNSVLDKTWILSRQFGWVEGTSGDLRIANVYSSGCVKQAPNWFNYKVYAGGIPADGTLTVKLSTPYLTQNHGTRYNTSQKYGAAFKNVIFNILHDEKPLPKGLDYEITLNKSTKAESKEIKIIGGDVPDVDNKLLQFGAYASLGDYHISTGLWTAPGITGTAPLITLLAKLYASENRKAKQYLTGSIRGEVIDFDTVLQHDYPTSRKFEIIEASYSLCADRADVMLVELFDYVESAFIAASTDLSVTNSKGTQSGSNDKLSFEVIDAVTWDALKLYLAGLSLSTTPADTRSMLISGAIVYKSGLTYASTDIVYQILGQKYTAQAKELTLAAAHSTLSRMDVFYVDTFGNLQVMTGTPASTPTSPILNSTQLEVMTALLAPAALVPSNIDIELVYDENVEWSTSESHDTNITVDFASTTAPLNGSTRIKVDIAIPDTEIAVPLHYIGEKYQGGVIFWLNAAGTAGLIASETDTALDVFWSALSGFSVYSTGATGSAIGTGQANMTLMLANDAAKDQAVRFCDTLIVDNYDDWYLPSEKELDRMYFRRYEIGGFANKTYWASTESAWNKARCIAFASGVPYTRDKNNRYCVRAIRAFDDTTLPANQPITSYKISETGLTFVAPAPVDVASGILSLNIKSSLPWLQNSILQIESFLGTVRTGSVALSPATSMFSYKPDDDSWQMIALQMYQFAPSKPTLDSFKISLIGSWPNNIDLGFDDIRYQHSAIVTAADVLPGGKSIVEFPVATSTPSIENYNKDYAAKYGQYPTVKLFVIDADGNRQESDQKPIFEMVDGLISKIKYDIGGEITGFIIIS